MAGGFVSLYLLLYKLGFYGQLLCGAGSCQTVQASPYAVLLGVPVAGWGVAWYAAVFAGALAWLQPALEDARWLRIGLEVAAASGLAFSLWLTWIELFELRAICQWCLVSAVLVTGIAGLVAWDRLSER